MDPPKFEKIKPNPVGRLEITNRGGVIRLRLRVPEAPAKVHVCAKLTAVQRGGLVPEAQTGHSGPAARGGAGLERHHRALREGVRRAAGWLARVYPDAADDQRMGRRFQGDQRHRAAGLGRRRGGRGQRGQRMEDGRSRLRGCFCARTRNPAQRARFSGIAPPSRRGHGPKATPAQSRNNTVVSSMFQACFNHVSSLFEASSVFLPGGPRAGLRHGPAYERRGGPRRPGLRYRVRKGWQGYRELTGYWSRTCTCAGRSNASIL